jgi:hypothetical protein
MLTSAECREMAKQKLIQAEHEPQRRTRLLTAAQGWLVLESELRQLEGTRSSYPEFLTCAKTIEPLSESLPARN